MDMEKLIEQLNDWNEKYISSLCGDRTIKCEEYCIKDDCLIVKAATAISTLQAENAQLRESRDHWKRLAHELSEGVNGKDAEHERLQAENEKLRAELDAARAALAELTGLADGSVQTLFGVPLERMWELSQAELEGRIVLRSAGAGRREVSSLRERLAAGGWIDPAVELPPNDDVVLAIVSGKPVDNITLVDAYVLATYGSGDWVVEQYELWETPVVSWWRPLPDPPEKTKEEL